MSDIILKRDASQEETDQVFDDAFREAKLKGLRQRIYTREELIYLAAKCETMGSPNLFQEIYDYISTFTNARIIRAFNWDGFCLKLLITDKFLFI